MEKIGILGSGVVAQTLGSGFVKHGYRVMLGTRDPRKLEKWQAANGDRASAGSVADASGFGDMLVLAVKGTAALAALTGHRRGPGRENHPGCHQSYRRCSPSKWGIAIFYGSEWIPYGTPANSFSQSPLRKSI